MQVRRGQPFIIHMIIALKFNEVLQFLANIAMSHDSLNFMLRPVF